MPRNNRAPILLLALTAAAPAMAQDVDGRVLADHSGEPLASAELRFHKSGLRELAADLDTGRDGRFRASGLPAGEYTVDVSKPNYVTTTLRASVPFAALEIRLVRYAVIAGTVLDSDGKPVPGRVLLPGGRTGGSARIAVLMKQSGTEDMKVVRTVSLEEGGRYRIFDLPPGQYAVGLWWAGLSVGSGAQMYPDSAHPRIFTVAGGEDYRNIDFFIAPGAAFSVSGKIEGPRPDMAFSLALGLPQLPSLPVAQLWTEKDGTFRIEKVSLGTYDLYASGPTGGYGAFETLLGKDPVFGKTRIQVTGQNLEGVSVPVSAGRSLDVVLRGTGEGTPAGCPQTATVALTMLEPWGVLPSNPVPASFGKPQTIRDLAPALYRLWTPNLAAGCFQVSQPVVDLNREISGPVAIQLSSAGSIRGTLRAGSAQAKDFAVLLLDAEGADATPAKLAFPDEQGRFDFSGLRPGKYRIGAQLAAGPGKARWVGDIARMREIEVAGGVSTDLDLAVSQPR